MLAKDIMTTKVITVAPESTVEEIGALLLKHGISAVPVLSKRGGLVGLVSEGDLIRRAEGEAQRSWWLELLAGPAGTARDYIKTHGRTAADVMTPDPVTVEEETPTGEIARLLERKRIKRVPVLRDGVVVGIVSRANLLHGLATQKDAVAAPTTDDREIRRQVLAAVEQQGWTSHGTFNVMVKEGLVELWGWIDSEEERKALNLAAKNVPGVKQVEDHLAQVAPYLRGV